LLINSHNTNGISIRSAIFAQLTAQSRYPTAHPKRHLDWISRFCAAHRRESLYFAMGRPSSLKIAVSPSKLTRRMGIWILSNTCFLGASQVLNPKGISIG